MASEARQIPVAHKIVATNSQSQELARSFRTIVEMLRDRGDDTSRLEQVSADDLVQAAAGRQTFYLDDAVSGYRIVYDLSDKKFKLPNIRRMLDPEAAADAGVRAFVIVVYSEAVKAENAAHELGADAQAFELQRLQFNLTRHELVPKHEAVRDEAEIARVLERFNVRNRFMLPIIHDKDPVHGTDPMVRYLALRHGQLVRIYRDNPSSGVHVMYRCCCTGGAASKK